MPAAVAISMEFGIAEVLPRYGRLGIGRRSSELASDPWEPLLIAVGLYDRSRTSGSR